MGKKATGAELEQRITTIYSLLLSGNTYFDIVRYAEKKWRICSRTADIYIAKAREIIARNAEQTQKDWMDETKSKLLTLYKLALDENDRSECRRIIETANKVLGYEKLNVNVEEKKTFVIKFPDEEE